MLKPELNKKFCLPSNDITFIIPFQHLYLECSVLSLVNTTDLEIHIAEDGEKPQYLTRWILGLQTWNYKKFVQEISLKGCKGLKGLVYKPHTSTVSTQGQESDLVSGREKIFKPSFRPFWLHRNYTFSPNPQSCSVTLALLKNVTYYPITMSYHSGSPSETL